MRIHEFPDQSTRLYVNDPVLYRYPGTSQGVSVGSVVSIHYNSDGPARYGIADQTGRVADRIRPEDVAPATPANITYLASECRRAYDRAQANYRVTSIYEPTTQVQ